MNFGIKSRDLLVELKRSDWLPAYNEDGVRGVLAEIQALYDELTDTLGGRTTVRITITRTSDDDLKWHGVRICKARLMLLHGKLHVHGYICTYCSPRSPVVTSLRTAAVLVSVG